LLEGSVGTDVPSSGTFEAKLWALAEAAVLIGSQRSVDGRLRVTAEQARSIIGAQIGSASLTVTGSGAHDGWPQGHVAVSSSPGYASRQGPAEPPGDPLLYGLVCAENRVVRMTDEQLHTHPLGPQLDDQRGRRPPLRGWLAAPLVASDGTNLGLLQLSDRDEGEFVAVDEAILVQLAQLASVAVENALLHEQLMAQERQELTEDLLAGLSHDMQTPLAVILGAMQVLQAGPDAPVEQRLGLYELLQTQADRLQRLVQQLLDYVRLESDQLVVLRRERLDLRVLLDDLVGFTGPGRLRPIEVPSDLPPVEADPDRLMQVLSNLVGNAIKFSAEPVQLEVRAEADGLRIDVVDRGEGIEPTELALVFDKLYRTDRAREAGVPGHGLGLYVSRSLVQAMGGTLTVASAPGVGSRFTVWLPAGEGRP
jgi:signal transduction histidine kinase